MADYPARSESNEVRDPNAKSEADFISDSIEVFRRIASAESDNRQNALDDLRFLTGDQWDPADKQARGSDRPCLTINQLPQFTKEVVNDMRQRRPQIKISAGEDGDTETAKTIDGLVREIQYKSAADSVYDSGMEAATRHGFGYWRVLQRYVDEKSFDQELVLQRIRNPFTVYYGPHINPDGSDVDDVYVTDTMSRERFERMYPGKNPVSWDSLSDGDRKSFDGWVTNDDIRIAERFYRVRKRKTLVMLDDGSTIFRGDPMPPGRVLKLREGKEVTRETTIEEIHWCKMTCREILDRRKLDGCYIPVIPVWGDEFDIEGKVIRQGLIRNAKDPQRAYNYWFSTSTELVALAPKAPWVGIEGQFKGQEAKWAQANRVAFPYLEYAKVIMPGGQFAPPPQRQPFAEMPQGVMQMMIICREDLRTTTGRYQRAELAPHGPEQSGSALLQERMKGELGSFNYVDNLSRAIEFTGKVLVDLIPYVYDRDNRKVLTRGEDNSTEYVTINDTEKKRRDVRKGTYNVVVNVGPGFSTRRQEGARAKLEFMQADPSMAPFVRDLIARGMDWDDADEIANRLKAMLPAEIKALEGDDEGMAELLAELPPKAREIVMSMRSQLTQATAALGNYDKALKEAAKQLDDKQAILATDRYKVDAQNAAKMAVAEINAAVKIALDENAQKMGEIATQVAQISTAFSQVTGYLTNMQDREKQLAAAEAEAQQRASAGPIPNAIRPEAAAGQAQPGIN